MVDHKHVGSAVDVGTFSAARADVVLDWSFPGSGTRQHEGDVGIRDIVQRSESTFLSTGGTQNYYGLCAALRATRDLVYRSHFASSFLLGVAATTRLLQLFAPLLASAPRRHMTHIILLNTRIPTRLALLAHLAALACRRTLALLRLAEGIQSC